MGNGAVVAAAAAAAIAQAIKASGAIVRVAPRDFEAILARTQAPLVVTAYGGVFRRTHQYLTSYKGLAFFTSAPDALRLPDGCEVVSAGKIWIPG